MAAVTGPRNVVRFASSQSDLPRELRQVARIVLVAVVAWQVCVWLGADHPPVFAVLVPLVSLRDDPSSAVNVSIARLLGVIAALTVGTTVLHFLRPGAIAIGLVLTVALCVGIVVGTENVINVQVAASALLVVSNLDAGGYGLTRFWETAVGTIVTLALAPFLFADDSCESCARRTALSRRWCGVRCIDWSRTWRPTARMR